MITSVKLTGNYAKRVGATRQRTFKFEEGVNLLVGPNGSGKSTIFEAIQKSAAKNEGRGSTEGVEVKTSGPVSTYFFDFEKGNIRTNASFMNGNLFGVQFASMFRSHGEVNRFLAEGLLRRSKIQSGVVMLDEPDQALDYDGVVRLVVWLKECPAKQAIVAVHHPLIVLQPVDNVIELRKGYCKEMREALRALIVV